MSYKEQARDIIQQAQQEAEEKLRELITVSLPSELKRIPKSKQAGHLSERIEKLNKHLAKTLNPLLDIEKRGLEVVINALASLIYDREEDGKQLPSNIRYIQRIKDNEATRLYAAYLTSIVDGKVEELSSGQPEPVRLPKPKQPEPPLSFEELTPVIKEAFAALDLLNSSGQFIGKPGAIKILYEALTKQSYIIGSMSKVYTNFPKYFTESFGGTVTSRTLRSPLTQSQEEKLPEFLAAIPPKPSE